MVASSDLIRVIADRLHCCKAMNIVVDPVMVSTSNAALIKTDAVSTLTEELLPLATLITPNKGGHCVNDANDLLYSNGTLRWFEGKRIDNPNTHGTGCTLSSAIAANLAKGYTLEKSVERAKDYISGALAAMLDLGKGSGPMNHAFALNNKYSD